MNNGEFIIEVATNERLYTKCYHDFMDCTLLNGTEKIVFLALKRFLNIKNDSGEIYPTLEKICKMLEYSRPTVTKTINSLIKKGIIKKTRQGLNKPNKYILYDYPTMWGCGSIEDMQAIIKNDGEKPTTPEKLIAELETMGYEVTIKAKEKESNTSQPTTVKDEQDSKTSYDINSCDYNTTHFNKCQVAQEQYTEKDLKRLYNYDTMITDNPYLQEDIDSVIDFVYDAVNTQQPIKIMGEYKPCDVVVSRLLKLSYMDIIHAINQYKQQSQTTKITNRKAYIISILYNVKADANMDIVNQVQYDLANGELSKFKELGS
jgi:predicted transcriptional regulator